MTAKEMDVKALIRSEFEEWLNGIDDSKVVGIPRDSQRCPLALYLQDTTKETYLVYRTYYCRQDYGKVPTSWVLPKWAYAFVLGLDKMFDTVADMGEATVADCKKVLASIPRSEDENEDRVA